MTIKRFYMLLFAFGWFAVFGTSFGCRVVSTGTAEDYTLSYNPDTANLKITMNISDTVTVGGFEDDSFCPAPDGDAADFRTLDIHQNSFGRQQRIAMERAAINSKDDSSATIDMSSVISDNTIKTVRTNNQYVLESTPFAVSDKMARFEQGDLMAEHIIKVSQLIDGKNPRMSFTATQYIVNLDGKTRTDSDELCGIYKSNKHILKCSMKVNPDRLEHDVTVTVYGKWVCLGNFKHKGQIGFRSPALHWPLAVPGAPSEIPADPCAADPVAEGCEADGDPAADTDEDGVPDADDLCADTPAETEVDADGCAIPPDAPIVDTTRGSGIGGVGTDSRSPADGGDGDEENGANGDAGCTLTGSAIANPLAFLLIGLSLAPMAWRRRK